MELDAETRMQIAVSLVGVGIFIAAATIVSMMYRTNGHIDPQGGMALVGVLLLFIVVMGAAGLWLAHSDF
jgi:hypothetical protein